MFKKIKDKIKAFLIEKMGKERYCKEFHEAFGDKNDDIASLIFKSSVNFPPQIIRFIFFKKYFPIIL